MEKNIRKKRIRAAIIALILIGAAVYAIYHLNIERADYHKVLGEEIKQAEVQLEKNQDEKQLKLALDEAKHVYSDDSKVYDDYKKAFEKLKQAEQGKEFLDEEKGKIAVFVEIKLSDGVTASGDPYILRKEKYECEKGLSVLDVLYKECRNHDIQLEVSSDSSYVEGIDGIYEYDEGTGSGWMFSVNGKYPTLSCSDLEAEDGDYILWEYICSKGEN